MSLTVTGNATAPVATYSGAPPATTAWRTTTRSCVASVSATAASVTVCPVAQSVVPKLSTAEAAPSTVTAPASALATVTVTAAVGSTDRRTVYASLASAPVSLSASTPVPRLTTISAPSSSVTSTPNVTGATASYSSELPPATTACVSVTDSCAASPSCTASTAIVCPFLQSAVPKVRVWDAPALPPALFTVTAASPLLTRTCTSPTAGGVPKRTVYAAMAPSRTASAALRLSTTAAVSSSSMVTVTSSTDRAA